MNRLAALLPLAVLLIIVAVGAFMLLRQSDAPREKFEAGLVGEQAPAYTLERLGGGAPVASVALRGRPYLVNVFASWCAPCRAEHGQLMALKAQGVEIVGIAYKDEAADTARFIAELGDPFSAIGMDPDGRFGLELGVTGAPETYVIGADGTVRAVHRGALTPDIVQTVIMPALR